MSDNSFQVDIDNLNENTWNELLAQFDDASIYQTWSYGTVCRGAGNVSHLVLRRGDKVVGCCQVVFNRMPVLDVGIAYVAWGPLWRMRGIQPDPSVLVKLISEVKLEYGIKRGYLLRMSPNAFGDHKNIFMKTMERERFKPSASTTPYRTLRLDLAPSLDDIRKNLLQKWRNALNKAERSGLTLLEGAGNDLYGRFLALAQQMLGRKKFIPGVNYEVYRRIQSDLPDRFKMHIAVCESQGEPIAAAICSAIGDTAIYILGATGDKNKGLNGSYMLHWHMIQWVKQHNCRWYDLGGIDPQGNPGVYTFKLGLAGKNGADETVVGEYVGLFTRRAAAALCMLKIARAIKSRLGRK
jgi:lipid II:glycine glycyltransferase (peptidoglycan interpeptide bridge formation enzyme)